MAAKAVRAGLVIGAILVAPGLTSGCSCGDESESTGSGGAGSGSGGEGGSLFPTGSGGSGGCSNLECQQVTCENGKTTTVTGTVYEPAGKVPLYNVTVYVPNKALDPIVDGASCEQCASSVSGDPVVSTLTDTHGRFTLENVPVGNNIPLVIQVGKWRREFVLPKVNACEENPTVDTQVRLPRNKTEGHIPKIALTTGGADPLECWLKKVGIDLEEFTNPEGDGRVNLFAGPGAPGPNPDPGPGSAEYDASGEPFEPATDLWASLDSLMRYDVVLLACESDQNTAQKPQEARQAMLDYTSHGGRVFASHWHNYWIQAGPAPWPSVATWDFEDDPPDHPFIGTINQSFPKGDALAKWLMNVDASTTLGELEIKEAQHTLEQIDTSKATRWIYSEAPITKGLQYFTFNTPVNVPDAQKCGRVVYSDIHVSSGDHTGEPFPEGCTTTNLSPQEKALLFMLFDLSACILPDDEPPTPPE